MSLSNFNQLKSEAFAVLSESLSLGEGRIEVLVTRGDSGQWAVSAFTEFVGDAVERFDHALVGSYASALIKAAALMDAEFIH
jgi:hypothetical protein